MTTLIPIYNDKGVMINQIEIDDDVTFLHGRISKGKNCYYKGVGIWYDAHSVESYNEEEYDLIRKDNVFYLGYYVSKKCFKNKFGIFQEKHQPQLSDFIGTCGTKELNIIENSVEFERSSVEVLKSFNYDKENQQYYFKLNYSCDRKRYIENYGEPKTLRDLLDYMLQTDWNFIWDKKSIRDVSYDGRISDVAEIFKSSDLISKVGTVYSILYSFGHLYHDRYLEFLKYNGLEHKNLMSYIFNGIEILKQNGIDISPLLIYDTPYENYKHIVLNYLIQGKNCGHCSYVDKGDQIKEQYVKMISSLFNKS